MKQKMKPKDIIMRGCILVLIIFMIIVAARMFTRQILVKKLGVDNSYTQFILSGIIEDSSANPPQDNGGWKGRILSIEGKIEDYTSEYLTGYRKFVELEKAYEDRVGWNLAAYGEYNGINTLADGALTEFLPKTDVTGNIEAIVDFSSYCKEQGSEFLYIQAPYKVSKYADREFSGVLDFSNQNADELVAGLEANNVSYLDLREEIHARKMDHHSLFYRTDHHWKAETGLWVSAILAEKLNADYQFEIEKELFDSEKYEFQEYKDWFLGAHGKKATLSQTTPDDFTLIYPKFETSFQYQIPDREVDETGDFSVVYDMTRVEERDYYNLNPYAAYNYGDNALTFIHNLDKGNGKRVLIVKDSFADCVVPFFALGVEYTDVIDLRYYTDSTRAYIEQIQPDLVLVLYNPTAITPVEYDTHTALFDFQ